MNIDDIMGKALADLQAANEITALKAEVQRLKVEQVHLFGQLGELEAENAHLKNETIPLHQYERVIKAGDAMVSKWASGDEKDAQNFLKALEVWNAAKNGWDKANA
jgi:phage shock protein A